MIRKEAGVRGFASPAGPGAGGRPFAADVKAQSSTQYLWYAAQLLYDSLDELDDGVLNGSVVFSGKAAFFR